MNPIEPVKKTEADLCEKILLQYSDWDLYKEVPISHTSNAGSLDIIAEKAEVRITIEAKLKINFDVLAQAYRNRRYGHFSYIAVPKPKNVNQFFAKICRDYGIGVLFVDKDGNVLESIQAKFNRSIVKLKLEDWMKESIAGSLHGRNTVYSITMEKIEHELKRHKGRINISNLLGRSTYHWGNSRSAKQCIMSYIKKGYITNMKYDKGYLVLLRQSEIEK